MMTSRRKMEELLWVSGLHAPARALYAATLGRQARLARNQMREFYERVLQPGALVFDIGANVGVVSAVFASLVLEWWPWNPMRIACGIFNCRMETSKLRSFRLRSARRTDWLC